MDYIIKLHYICNFRILYIDVWQNGRILNEEQCLTDLLFFDVESSDIQLFLRVLDVKQVFQSIFVSKPIRLSRKSEHY